MSRPVVEMQHSFSQWKKSGFILQQDRKKRDRLTLIQNIYVLIYYISVMVSFETWLQDSRNVLNAKID